ncbi:NTF2-related export protein-like [Ctenocephalides felis]|uniref:NTF2-related export protein-like n=1 Tax=Ctenocephalides felis TaxID=7515 RepID=UPI000E6E1FEB|nr:NTF2-related export protein-like [Ctenocephalides felis]
MDLKTSINAACRTAEEFTKLYYETMDKRRHLMSKLYLDTGILAWNGNGSTGKDAIQKYFSDLPPSEHKLLSLDAQPVLEDAVSSQHTILILVSGTVKFNAESTDVKQRSFQQHFLVTAQGDKWKIASDCVRHHQ